MFIYDTWDHISFLPLNFLINYYKRLYYLRKFQYLNTKSNVTLVVMDELLSIEAKNINLTVYINIDNPLYNGWNWMHLIFLMECKNFVIHRKLTLAYTFYYY